MPGPTAKTTLFFYDLETSGLDPRRQRIMQFAGIRTDLDLNVIGDPIDIQVALADDVLPDPGAIMVTGITPQATNEAGYSEADFCRMVHEQVCAPGTIMVGFNNVRFDDEFMRHTFFRNFYDAYEWCWLDGRSRWDILDVVRLTRAVRPDGMQWPVTDDGKPVNKLEPIAAINGITHTRAHDALSDVEALIDVARLIKTNQPKLFSYMLDLRDKRKVEDVIKPADHPAFVYASGRYGSMYNFTTAAMVIGNGTQKGRHLVWDLRVNPEPFMGMNAHEIADAQFKPRNTAVHQTDQLDRRLPVKELVTNKCPAVAPMGVLDDAARERLQLDMAAIEAHRNTLLKRPAFLQAIADAYAKRPAFEKGSDVDGQLYDGFVGDGDKTKMAAVRAASRDDLKRFDLKFSDQRLTALLPRYKARNYPTTLTDSERAAWEDYRAQRLAADMPSYVKVVEKLAAEPVNQTEERAFLLEELKLWLESIAPSDYASGDQQS